METMETVVSILLNPITLVITGLVILLGVIVSPYEITFDEREEE